MMFSHVVLMKPKPDLTADARRAFVAAFEVAVKTIPSVRAVRVGNRVIHGAGYEQSMPDTGAYVAIIDFDDLAGLQSYLQNPAHQRLGELFYQSLSSAFVYDFEVGGLERLRDLEALRPPPAL